MKEGIHPTYHPAATVTCACGNAFTVGSTKPEIHTEVCSACHPFYTGQKKLMDTAGRVERYARILEKTKAKRATAATTTTGQRVKKSRPRKERTRLG